MDLSRNATLSTSFAFLLFVLLLSGCNNDSGDLSLSMGSGGRDETSILFAQIDELKQDRAKEAEIRARMQPRVAITAPGTDAPVDIVVAAGDTSMSNFTASYSNESTNGLHSVKVDWIVDRQSIAEVTYFLNFDNGVWSAVNEEGAVCEDGSSCVIAASDEENKPVFPDTDEDQLPNLWELNMGTEWFGDQAQDSPVPGGMMQDQVQTDDLEPVNLVVLQESLEAEENFSDWGALGKLIIRADDQIGTELAHWRANYFAGKANFCVDILDDQVHQAQVVVAGFNANSLADSACTADEVAYTSNITNIPISMFDSLLVEFKISDRADGAEVATADYSMVLVPTTSSSPTTTTVSAPESAEEALRNTGQHDAFLNLVVSAYGNLNMLNAADKMWTWFAPVDSAIPSVLSDDHRTFVDKHIYFAGSLGLDELALLDQITTNNQNVSDNIVTSPVVSSNGDIMVAGHRITSLFSYVNGPSILSIEGVLSESGPTALIVE